MSRCPSPREGGAAGCGPGVRGGPHREPRPESGRATSSQGRPTYRGAAPPARHLVEPSLDRFPAIAVHRLRTFMVDLPWSGREIAADGPGLANGYERK